MSVQDQVNLGKDRKTLDRVWEVYGMIFEDSRFDTLTTFQQMMLAAKVVELSKAKDF